MICHIPFDEKLVRLGVVFHDGGKILHPEELITPGKKPEREGEAFVLSNGDDPKISSYKDLQNKMRNSPLRGGL